MTKKRIITVGTDPEVFLRSKSTGHFVSAHGLFPGSKEEPFALGNYGHVQVDGHALEFNSIPASTEDEFVANVTNIFDAVKELVRGTDDDLEIVLEPIATFEEDYFESLPFESKVLGCTPDFSAISGGVLNPPEIGNLPFRTSSGHIHIGWTAGEDPFEDNEFATRLMVASRITPHLLKVAQRWEVPNSIERRKYYGREMAFRPKPYGVELRALDCLWLKDEKSMREVYRTAVSEFEHIVEEMF